LHGPPACAATPLAPATGGDARAYELFSPGAATYRRRLPPWPQESRLPGDVIRTRSATFGGRPLGRSRRWRKPPQTKWSPTVRDGRRSGRAFAVRCLTRTGSVQEAQTLPVRCSMLASGLDDDELPAPSAYWNRATIASHLGGCATACSEICGCAAASRRVARADLLATSSGDAGGLP